MKLTLEPSDIQLITPAALAEYLTGIGFIKTQPYGDFSDVWQNDGLGLIVPHCADISDYHRCVMQVIQDLSEILQENMADVYYEIIFFEPIPEFILDGVQTKFETEMYILNRNVDFWNRAVSGR